jgi:hypothetical protein
VIQLVFEISELPTGQITVVLPAGIRFGTDQEKWVANIIVNGVGESVRQSLTVQDSKWPDSPIKNMPNG